MIKLKTIIGVVILVFCIMSFGLTTYANENTVTFSVEALTEDGKSNDQGFYHFEGEPGNKEYAKIKVTNLSSKPVKIAMEVNAASTNQNGIPSYRKVENQDNTLKYPMDKLIHLEQDSIELGANENKIIDIIVNNPEEKWDGQILGGIRFSEVREQKSQQAVTHEIAYTIGILLKMKEGTTPENQLQLNNIKVSQRNYRNFVEANLQNTTAVIVSNMEVNAQVSKKGSDKVIYEYMASELRMAPNSNFDFGIPTGDAPLQPGKYQLKLTVQADEKKYVFDGVFEITQKQANQLNKSAVNIEEKTPISMYMKIIIGILILILVINVYVYYRKRKNSHGEN
ncbi:DUF916 and DUF3324 domain-containing protein [Enterococcus faecalis]|nr:DUF916 and DUF3324 domain-containing protein [Enterococcus faecalis]